MSIPIQEGSAWRADQPIVVKATEDRVSFPCHEVLTNETGNEFIVRFLFKGREDLVVDVDSANGPFVQVLEVTAQDLDGDRTLLRSWWTRYSKQLVQGPSLELSQVGFNVASALARQLQLFPSPVLRKDSSEETSDLDKQFARSVGMLFGLESVRLAMMKDTSPVRLREGKAVSALPTALRVAAVPIPSVTVSNQ